jgi:hypothetical protein
MVREADFDDDLGGFGGRHPLSRLCRARAPQSVDTRVRDEVAIRLHHPRIRFVGVSCGTAAGGEPGVSVLLIEAGGEENVRSVNERGQWFLNLGTERDWNFSGKGCSVMDLLIR